MPTEQELQLIVKLTDQATPGLRALKQEIANLGQGGDFAKLNEVVNHIAAQHGKMGEHAKGLTTEINAAVRELGKFASGITGLPLGEFGRSVSEMTGGIGGFATGLAALPGVLLEVVEAINSFAERTTHINTMAGSVGLLAGQFKVLSDQVHEAGFSIERSQQLVASFTRTVGQLTRPGSPELMRLMGISARPQEWRGEAFTLQRMQQAGQGGAAMERLIKDLAREETRQRGLGYNAQTAAENVNRLAGAFGLDPEWRRLREKHIREATEEEIKAQEGKTEAAEQAEDSFARAGKAFQDSMDQALKIITPEFAALADLFAKFVKDDPLAAVGTAALGLVAAFGTAAVGLRAAGWALGLGGGKPPVVPLPAGAGGLGALGWLGLAGVTLGSYALEKNIGEPKTEELLKEYDKAHPGRKPEEMPGLTEEQRKNLGTFFFGKGRLGYTPEGTHPADTPPSTAAPDVSSPRLSPPLGGTPMPEGAHPGVHLLDAVPEAAIPAPTIPTTPAFKTPGQMQREQFQRGRAVRLAGGDWDTSHYGAWADMMGGPMSTNIEDRRGEVEDHGKLMFENTAELKRLNDWLRGLTGGPGRGTLPKGAYGLAGGGDIDSAIGGGAALSSLSDLGSLLSGREGGLNAIGRGGAGGFGGGGFFGGGGSAGGGGATGTWGGADAAGGGSALYGRLAEVRKGFGDELKNPEVARLLMASTAAEVGGQGAQAEQAYVESVMNRAAASGQSLKDVLNDPKYYPATTINKLGRTFGAGEQARYQGLFSQVLGGSNISDLATGNESGSVRSGGAQITFNPRTGERFVAENAWTAWRNKELGQLGSPLSGGPGAANIPAASKGDLGWLQARGGHSTGQAPAFNADLATRLRAAGEAYESSTGRKAVFGEMSRDYATQAEYYRRYLAGTGGIAAPPGRSRHEGGRAVDIPSGAFLEWMHTHGAEYGINFPVRGDPVHAQLINDPVMGTQGAGRAALNRSALTHPVTHRVEGSASIDVNVAAPPGTRVAASSAGMFKPVQMNRQTQMAFADGGPHVPAGSQFGVAS